MTDAAVAALDDAVTWFHRRLDDEIPDHTDSGTHPERPTTAREWFADTRGFSATTIDNKRLGWVPADATDALLEHLTRRGHSRDAIKATGLFTDDLRLLWRGRYVFPYFDEDGRAVYAIGRATGGLGGGAAGYDGHPADFIAGKYAKLAHTKEYVDTDEPIYGLSTLDRDGPVIITEGVADAIRAHECGYACLSPVTTQFKKEHREDLADILEDTGRRTYIVQDAERPVVEHTDDDAVEGWQALGLEQYGEGIKGAARTAAFLSDAGIDAYLAELPRLGLDKVDLDDYLADWADDLDAVLAGAKPGEQHPAYEVATIDSGASDAGDWSSDIDGRSGANGYRDLTREEVIDALDHVSTTLSYDEWIQLGFAVHAWDDTATGRQVFERWSRQSPKWDTPESPNAIEWIWNNADAGAGVTVGTLIARAKAGGWEPPQRNPEPVGAIPFEKLDALDPAARRRAAKRRGLEIPKTDEVHSRLRDTIFREMRNGNTTVINAPTSAGKSYGVATEPWLRRSSVTGGAPVIQLSASTDARDEAAKDTADSMATGAVLRGRKEASPLARGDHDPVDGDDEEQPDIVVTIDGIPASEWFDRMCDEKGIAFSTALAIARERNDQQLDELPPIGQEDPAVAQWDGIPRDDDGEPAKDVIHATHQFAYVPSIRSHTNLVFDEQPDFTVDLGQDDIRCMVNAYLQEIGAPVTNFERFVTLAENESMGTDASKEQDALGDMLDRNTEVRPEWYIDDPDAHALAPGIARAIWNALRWEDADRNNRMQATVHHEQPRFDADGERYNAGTWLSVVVDGDHNIRTVRACPDLRDARAVIGLDAHPSMPMWQLNTVPDIDEDAVLDATERQLWRRYGRKLEVVQLGDATRPRSGSNAIDWMNTDRVRAVLQKIREHYGGGFSTAISTAQTEGQLRELLDDVAPDAGIDDENTMHYGEEKSRNDFAGETAGYVYGCMDPGDEFVLDTLAELGLDATPGTAETDDGDVVREKGRTFEGPDADTADAVLASVRESHVAQAVGRYARDADSDGGATVYLDTNAAPAGLVDHETPGVEWVATDLQRDIIGELTERRHATTADLADAVDCSKEHTRETLQRLADGDDATVSRHRGVGENGADVYRGASADDAIVALGATTNDALKDTNRWSLAIDHRHRREKGPNAGLDGADTPVGAHAGVDSPPDPAD
jgi:hypothetical protein